MKYAVVRLMGHQYKVEEGKDFLVPKIDGELAFETLLVVNEEKVDLGTPTLEKHKVSMKIVDPLVLGEKIDVFKYKAKARYRKHIGSRPQYTRVMVEKVA